MLPTVLLLTLSNIFMTIAWYWHLRHTDFPIWQIVLLSWSIALIEYSIAVPANRIGMGHFSAYQLKILQEVITILVFVGFAMAYLGVMPKWNHLVAFALIVAAVFFGMMPDKPMAQVNAERLEALSGPDNGPDSQTP